GLRGASTERVRTNNDDAVVVVRVGAVEQLRNRLGADQVVAFGERTVLQRLQLRRRTLLCVNFDRADNVIELLRMRWPSEAGRGRLRGRAKSSCPRREVGSTGRRAFSCSCSTNRLRGSWPV